MEVIFVICSDADFSGMFAVFFLKQNEVMDISQESGRYSGLRWHFSVMILVCYMDYSWIGKHARLFGRQLSVVYGSDETFFLPFRLTVQ